MQMCVEYINSTNVILSMLIFNPLCCHPHSSKQSPCKIIAILQWMLKLDQHQERHKFNMFL
jgi:hypothetical protein